MRRLSSFEDWKQAYPMTLETLESMLEGADKRERSATLLSTFCEPAELVTEKRLHSELRAALEKGRNNA